MSIPSADQEQLARGFEAHRRGDLATAAACYERAIALNPRSADALHLLGSLKAQAGAPQDGLQLIERAIAVDAGKALFWCNHGNTLKLLRRLADAIASFDRALALEPAHEDALYNKGNALRSLGRLDEAIASFDRLIARSPAHSDARFARADCLVRVDRRAQALEDYEQAVGIAPQSDALSSYGQLVLDGCDWQRAAAVAPLLDCAVASGQANVSPFVYLGFGRDALAQRRCSELWAARLVGAVAAMPPRPAARRDRIRIGYLSSDFRYHAMSFLIAGMIEGHDRSRFEVHGFSAGPDDGTDMRRRMQKAFDRFHDVATLTDGAIATAIREREIDIIVDLNGWSSNTRIGALAPRPAPVQVTYLGFPGTLGTRFVDYTFTDRWVAPLEAQAAFCEQLAVMPDCYFVNDAKREIAAAVPSRADCGLPPDAFVLCCFNSTYKIIPPVFAAWMGLLKQVPGSVLWLLRSNELAETNLRAAAAGHGVDPARLVFAPKVLPPIHLARHAHADLVLDTLPVNAHTTGCDALWTGVPFVTCMGDSFVGRVGASLLHAIGLPELVTTSLQDYAALALRLAQEPATLAAIKARLVANRLSHPLFDTARFTRHFEAAYEIMWDRHLAGEAPRGFVIPPVGPARA